VCVKTGVGFLQKIPIKALFTHLLFIGGNQQDRLADRVKRECNTLYLRSAMGIKTKLLHVWVLRIIECANVRATGLWPKPLHHGCSGKQVVLNFFIQDIKLGTEIIMKNDFPNITLRQLSSPNDITSR